MLRQQQPRVGRKRASRSARIAASTQNNKGGEQTGAGEETAIWHRAGEEEPAWREAAKRVDNLRGGTHRPPSSSTMTRSALASYTSDRGTPLRVIFLNVEYRDFRRPCSARMKRLG